MGEWHNPGNESLHMSQEAHQTRAYPGFCNMNWPGVFSSPPWMGCKSIARVTPSIKFAYTHLYTWVERGTVRIKCPAQGHKTNVPGEGLNLDNLICRQMHQPWDCCASHNPRNTVIYGSFMLHSELVPALVMLPAYETTGRYLTVLMSSQRQPDCTFWCQVLTSENKHLWKTSHL